jgi:hypothetical protein
VLPEARYSSDNRDLPADELRDLVISFGGNGDWYVQITPKDGVTATEVVRLSTSGGASYRCPGLTVAIAEAYRAIVASTSGRGAEPAPSYEDFQREVTAWRAKAAKYIYDPRDDAIVLREGRE